MAEEIHYSLDTIDSAAQRISQEISPGEILSFRGGLGLGKTTFIRALVKELKGAGDVTSPTYVLQHEYKAPEGVLIEHWDLYRIPGLPEELAQPCPKNVIRLIEWGNKSPELEQEADYLLDFLLVNDDPLSDLRVIRWEKRSSA